ncbi:MAG: SAM-dependent methyltransferase, partial [Ramlibacter sp.]
HFLTRHNDRALYVAKVIRSLKPGGFAIVATFGPHGPEQCSGLPVSRYSPQELHTTFGQPFGLLDSAVETHKTPWGASQEFVYCFCRRHAQ